MCTECEIVAAGVLTGLPLLWAWIKYWWPMLRDVNERASAKMDPNEALKDAREALKNVLGARGREHTNMEALDKLADAFEALDGWMSRGGFLPTEWAKGEEQLRLSETVREDPRRTARVKR